MNVKADSIEPSKYKYRIGEYIINSRGEERI